LTIDDTRFTICDREPDMIRAARLTHYEDVARSVGIDPAKC